MTLPLRAARCLTRRLALPLAVALSLAGGGALAQPPGYGGPPGRSFGPTDSSQQPSELATLHAALHITAAQEAAWNAFSSPPPRPIRSSRRASAPPSRCCRR